MQEDKERKLIQIQKSKKTFSILFWTEIIIIIDLCCANINPKREIFICGKEASGVLLVLLYI